MIKRSAYVLLSLMIIIILYACSVVNEPVQTPRPAGFETNGAESGKLNETPDAAKQTALPDEKSYCFDFRRTAEASLMLPYTPILETDDAVYYLFEGMIYVSDKVYKEFLPLCAKPNCNHRNGNCDARADAMNMSIWIYDRYIYYIVYNVGEGEPNQVTHPSLCRMRLDGMQNEEVMRLPEKELDYTPEYTAWSFVFLNKYLFITHTAYKKSVAMGGVPDSALFMICLDTMEVRSWESGMGIPIYSSGDIVYGVGHIGGENDEYIVRFYEYNIKTEEAREIGTEREWFYALNECYGVKDGEILYVTADRADLSAMRLWGMDIETGEKRLHYSTDDIYSSKWHTYLDYTNGYYLKSYNGYNDDPEEETRPNWGLYVTDTDGSVVSKYLYEDMPEDFLET
ncbi:MAG: hypothetical protein IKZ82_03425 [Clostridia bacterium]|nr:hypothetical protein [Clostridia bacterium]